MGDLSLAFLTAWQVTAQTLEALSESCADGSVSGAVNGMAGHSTNTGGLSKSCADGSVSGVVDRTACLVQVTTKPLKTV